MSETIHPGTGDVLLVVDPQNDFCPGGALAVPAGDAVLPIVNRLAERFEHVILTQDWHPRGHLSFASSHPEYKPFDAIQLPYGEQILWPDHCVQESFGAAFHRGLHIARAELIIRKGYHRNIDSYSAFYENDRRTPTGLSGYLRERELTGIFLAGLALDYCVRFSAEDARNHGFTVAVIEDACRGIGVGDSMSVTQRSFAEHNVRRLRAEAIG
jgi:nicotinamidase/pyrazinamidase